MHSEDDILVRIDICFDYTRMQRIHRDAVSSQFARQNIRRHHIRQFAVTVD